MDALEHADAGESRMIDRRYATRRGIGRGGVMPRGDVRVNVRFALPTTGEYVTSQAVVRWSRVKRERTRLCCAVGLEFVALDPQVRGAIEKFVRIVGIDPGRVLD